MFSVPRIDLRRDAQRFLRRLPSKHEQQIVRKIGELGANPEPHNSKLLKGKMSTFRRIAVGEYRVIYRLEGDTLRVYLVGKRNDDDVYRRFERMLRGGASDD